MTSRMPLMDLGNQRQPRPRMAQTYGKKKGRLPLSQQAQQAIFGQDENEIEERLAALNLQQESAVVESVGTERPERKTIQDCQSPIEEKARKQTPPVLPTSPSKQPTIKAKRARQKPQKLQPKQSDLVSESDQVAISPLLEHSERDIELFSALGSKLSRLYDIEKIGEGTFAEVFKLTAIETPSSSSKVCTQADLPSTVPSNPVMNRTTIIKVIPLHHPTSILNPEAEERRSSVSSVAREINLLKNLDALHGFIRFRGVRLVTGDWPKPFLNAFQEFKKRNRKRAINSSPTKDFQETQIYALVEMGDAGSEISLLTRPSVFQAWDVFWLSALLLMNAESAIQFEHRDLHMSNICVKKAPRSSSETLSSKLTHASKLTFASTPASPKNEKKSLVACTKSSRVATRTTRSGLAQSKSSSSATSANKKASSSQSATAAKSIPDVDPEVLKTITKNSPPINRLGLSNLRVTIIDYTIARARLPSSSSSPEEKKTKIAKREETNQDKIIYSPLLFTQEAWIPQPDIEAHVQHITYRKTEAAVEISSRQEDKAVVAAASATDVATTTDEEEEDTITPHHIHKWQTYAPRTNTIWLGYLLRILIHRSRGRTGKLQIVKGGAKEMQEEMWRVLGCVSALLNGGDFVGEVEGRKWAGRGECPGWEDGEVEGLPGSAGEVVRRSLEEGWLGEEEVRVMREKLEGEEEDEEEEEENDDDDNNDNDDEDDDE